MVFNIILLVIGAIVTGGVIWWYVSTGDRDRVDEDAARTFFEEHGHWPDQSAEEADEERRRSAAALAVSRAPVSRPADDGSV